METNTAEPLNAPAPWKSGVNQPVVRSRGPRRLAVNGRNRQPQWPVEFLRVLIPTAGMAPLDKNDMFLKRRKIRSATVADGFVRLPPNDGDLGNVPRAG